jgi:transcriptional regulator with XRE-family HTH domain
MTFADRLKELRRQAGLSQAQLAQKSGLSVDAIRDYEYGRREPSLKNGFRLAQALGTDCRAFAAAMEPDPPPAPASGDEAPTR